MLTSLIDRRVTCPRPLETGRDRVQKGELRVDTRVVFTFRGYLLCSFNEFVTIRAGVMGCESVNIGAK